MAIELIEMRISVELSILFDEKVQISFAADERLIHSNVTAKLLVRPLEDTINDS